MLLVLGGKTNISESRNKVQKTKNYNERGAGKMAKFRKNRYFFTLIC